MKNALFIMKTKKGKPILVKVLVVTILVFLANIGGLIYLGRNSFDIEAGFTGNSIKNIVSESNEKISLPARILFIGQWVFLGLLLLFAGYRDSRLRGQEIENIRINPSKEQTDLDKLYNILKDKKQLKIKNISELFHVENDVAIEWAKILESGDLVVIDYPMLGGAVVNYNENRMKEGNNLSEKNELNEKGLKGNEDNQVTEGKKVDEKKKNKKSKGLVLILFLITLGLAGYPLYWMINNNWNLKIIRTDIPAFVLSLLFLLSFFIFLIALKGFMFKKKKVEIKEIDNKDKQDNKKKDLNIEKKVEFKGGDKNHRGIFIFLLFLISLGLSIYPAFWLINNNWNFIGLRYNMIALIVSALFVLSVFLFLIDLIKFMFQKKKIKHEIKKNIDKRKKVKSKKKK